MNIRIEYKGKQIVLNAALIRKQNLSVDDVEKIKQLHLERMKIEYRIEKSSDKLILKELSKKWTENQFLLQDAWGFKRDQNYHKFWEVPKCSCPKLDNLDLYPSAYYWRDVNCVLHGG